MRRIKNVDTLLSIQPSEKLLALSEEEASILQLALEAHGREMKELHQGNSDEAKLARKMHKVLGT